jgi:hypothetical protein
MDGFFPDLSFPAPGFAESDIPSDDALYAGSPSAVVLLEDAVVDCTVIVDILVLLEITIGRADVTELDIVDVTVPDTPL